MDFKKTLLLISLSATVAGLTGCASWGSGSTSDGRTAGRAIDDRRLTDHVEEALRNEPVYKMKDVQVNTFQGVVQLSGFVDTQAQKQRAEQIARQTPGAVNVVNQITIKPQPVMPTGRQNSSQQSYGGTGNGTTTSTQSTTNSPSQQ